MSSYCCCYYCYYVLPMALFYWAQLENYILSSYILMDCNY